MSAFHIHRFNHGGVLLNLTGTRDDEECVIDSIKVDGNPQELIGLFDEHTREAMALAADAQLTAEYEAEPDNYQPTRRQQRMYGDMACA